MSSLPASVSVLCLSLIESLFYVISLVVLGLLIDSVGVLT